MSILQKFSYFIKKINNISLLANKTVNIFVLCFFILLNISCITCSTKNTKNTQDYKKNSFAFINVFFGKHPICDETKEDCSKKEPPELAASGVVYHHDVLNKITYIITAKHVCLNDMVVEAYKKDILTVFKITDFDGNIYYGIPIFTHKIQDLCLMKIRDRVNYFVPAKIANNPPKYGEEVYTLAAPLGTFERNMLPIFRGIFSGKLNTGEIENYLFTIPATFGSSGAPIFNTDGELVGIIHSVMSRFHHLTLSIPWEVLKELDEVMLDFRVKK